MQRIILGRSYKEWPFFFIAILAASIAFQACSDNQDSTALIEEDQQTLFSVDDIEVSTFEFNQVYLKYIIKNGRNDTKEERFRFLSRWKENLLLADQAINTGFTKHPAYVKAVAMQKRKTIADTYFVREMNEILPEITDDELRLAFAKSKRKVYPRQLYATTKEALEPYYQKLENGADFIALANEYYQTTTYDSLAGSLGSIGYYSVDDRFAEVAFSLNKGEYSEPFQSKLGWHIIWIEHIIFEAMLAEDEYQIKREGTLSKYRTRKANLYAGDYIKEQMQQLAVTPDRSGILTLKAELDRIAANNKEDEGLEQRAQTSNPEFWDSTALTAIEEALDGSISLATFEWDGKTKEFTVSDYLAWLPFLSANESRARTGASVGRAIRNEYFYLKGLEAGTDESFEVQRMGRNKGLDVLSELFQKEIINIALQDSSDITVPKWFVDRVYPNKRYELIATYSYQKTADSKEALVVKRQWEEQAESRTLEGVIQVQNQQMDSATPLFSLISKAILNEPLIANSQEYGWIVLFVSERAFEPIKSKNFNTDGSQLKQQFKVYTAFQDSLNKYNEQKKVNIDTTIFNKMYQLN